MLTHWDKYIFKQITVFILNLEVSIVEVNGGHHGVARVDHCAYAGCKEWQLFVFEVFASGNISVNISS